MRTDYTMGEMLMDEAMLHIMGQMNSSMEDIALAVADKEAYLKIRKMKEAEKARKAKKRDKIVNFVCSALAVMIISGVLVCAVLWMAP